MALIHSMHAELARLTDPALVSVSPPEDFNFQVILTCRYSPEHRGLQSSLEF